MALCETSFGAIALSCPWHTALGIGCLIFGPILVLISAGFSLHLYIEKHREDVFDHRDSPPSLTVLYRTMKRAKNVVGAMFVVRLYWKNAQVKGDWNDDPALHPTLHRWSWLISSCKSSTWWFSLWSLARRIIMVANVELIDGPANAILSLGIQILDTLLLCCLFPFNSYEANLHQAFGAVTNVLAYFAIALPIISPGLLPSWPSWLGDMVILALSVVATGTAALFAMVGPVLTVLGLVKAALVKMLGLVRQCSVAAVAPPPSAVATGGGRALALAHARSSGHLRYEIDAAIEGYFLPAEEEEEKEKDEEEGGGGADDHDETMRNDASVSENGGALATAFIAGGIVTHSALQSKPPANGDRGPQHASLRSLLERSRYCAA